MPIPPDRTLAGFFSCLSSPYYIYAPDFRQNSAGIRALHYLCHALNEMGHEAYVFPATVTNPYLRTPPLTAETLKHHFLTGRIPITVYPEVASGNPLAMPIVARWLLNQPGHLGGDASFPPDELLYHYDPWVIAGTGLYASQLKVPIIDIRIFNNDNNPYDDHREGACYYAHKFIATGGTVSEEIRNNAISLGQDIPRTPEEIASILRRSEVLYCYEQTALMAEALLCGCPVLIVPSDYWTATCSPDGFLPLGAGLASEPNILERLKSEVKGARAQQDEFHCHCWSFVENFATTSQEATQRFRQGSDEPATPSGSGDIDNPKVLWAKRSDQRNKYLPVFVRRYAAIFPDLVAPRAGNESPLSVKPDATPVSPIGGAEMALFETRIKQWPTTPMFHLVVTAEDATDGPLLARTLRSLATQAYTNVIVTVIGPQPAPEGLTPGRIVWWQTADNPSLLINDALGQSPADWFGVIRAGDMLSSHALLAIGEVIASGPHRQVIYCDEDTIDDQGLISQPHLKPAFDPILLRSSGYIGGLLLAQRDFWRKVGGWHPLPAGVAELDAALRLTDGCEGDEVGHAPSLLFHRRTAPVPDLPELRHQVVRDSLARRHMTAIVEPGLLPGLIRVRPLLDMPPRISILIPTRDHAVQLEACLTTLVEITDYPDFEILIIDHGTDESTAQAYLNGLRQLGDERIRVLSAATGTSLAAALNISAHEARGELLLLLHDDVTILHRDWLFNLASLAMQPGTGAVGGRLLKPDGTLQQGWLIPYKAGLTEPPFQGWPLDAPDSQIALNAEQEVSAVGSACMLVRKDLFLSLGGLDAESFPDTFADIDFCLTLRQAGHRILWTPFATLAHDSDGSLAGGKDDNNKLLAKWGKALVRDRCVNPYVSIVSSDYRPETDPAFLRDVITWHPVPNIYGMSSDMEGAGHYRVIQPVQGATVSCLARGRIARGYPVPVILEKLDIDVIYSQRQVEDQQLKNLARYRKLLNCRIVMDFDDLVTKVPEKSIHKKSVHKDMKSRLRQLGEIAHRFTVSTEPLAQEFRQYHDDVRIIPNALLRPLWENLKSARGTSAKPRVGWAGGVSHQGDLEIIRDVVRETANEVDWIFMGMWLKELAPYVKEVHDGVKFADYPAKLANLNLDLAVAPLEINHFNECKSHLRILEYGILGLPVIATDIHPYRGDFPITLIKNNKHQEWIKALRNHINDLDETRRRGDALREHVLNHWMLDQHLDAWLKAWTE